MTGAATLPKMNTSGEGSARDEPPEAETASEASARSRP
jgi:hypothetical protein